MTVSAEVTEEAGTAVDPADTTEAGAGATAARDDAQDSRPPVRVLGIRHHGPGSARALLAALEDYRPDCVLIEGPSDANDLIEWAGRGLEPPVALLAWDNTDPSTASFWPMAVFSPEWQALSWAAKHGAEARFMDLPAAAVLAARKAERERARTEGDAETAEQHVEEKVDNADGPSDWDTTEGSGEGDTGDVTVEDAGRPVRTDPIGELARLVGYEDPEAWWEDVVELRMEGDPFNALTEAIGLLREASPETDESTLRREAHMRKVLRAARKAGHERIAVVCGAWHAPALAGKPPKVAQDNALLKGMAKARTSLTWVPWTHRRLAGGSGYRAGVDSPGWYHLLFTAQDRPVVRWLTQVAASLRRQDLPVSSAHIIEAARLAQSLAALRGRPMAGLDELNESVLSVMCEGSAVRAAAATREVHIGEALGTVPDGVPMVPLDADLRSTARSLRMALAATPKTLTLDLRKPRDLAKSQLLRRLAILGITWGKRLRAVSKGTFKEVWELEWDPEMSVQVVEAAAFGTTVASAAGHALLAATDSLPQVTRSVEKALEAGLSDVVPELLRILDEQAAREMDIVQLLGSVPALARSQRYGDVRGTDSSSLAAVTRAVLVRGCAGLPAAAANVDAQAARTLRTTIDEVQGVIGLLDERAAALWNGALRSALATRSLPGLLAGRITRMLLDAGELAREDAALRLSRALSQGTQPEEQAEWIEGFLAGDILLLSYDNSLLEVLDEWLRRIGDQAFVDVLPALRRAFGQWSSPHKTDLARQVRDLASSVAGGGEPEALNDVDAVLDTVSMILGGTR
ncbi:DUF5682 family protein [Actinomyces viscosus]|uniref:Rhodanese domain-containing protein n=1 Tax=Actinomyces viscosus TaxID=1656 RepID=A0A448PMD8_ACTVI|nr:DUF5682 family protein [Actinomyces viscosus]VEI17030.1 Uncharacterised protein [Actinomyces viscosus]